MANRKTKNVKTPTPPKSVDFSAIRGDDYQCATLAQLGWHTKAIAARTGLTDSQVNYRCRQAGIKRREYRDGTNAYASIVAEKCMGFHKAQEHKEIGRQLNEHRLLVLRQMAEKRKLLSSKSK